MAVTWNEFGIRTTMDFTHERQYRVFVKCWSRNSSRIACGQHSSGFVAFTKQVSVHSQLQILPMNEHREHWDGSNDNVANNDKTTRYMIIDFERNRTKSIKISSFVV